MVGFKIKVLLVGIPEDVSMLVCFSHKNLLQALRPQIASKTKNLAGKRGS